MASLNPPSTERQRERPRRRLGRSLLARATEQLLHRSDVFLDARDAVLIVALDGCIVDLVDETVRAYGWSRNELVGQEVAKLIPPEWRGRADELRARSARGEPIRDVEGMHWTRDGTRVPVQLSFIPLMDAHGNPNAIALTARDVAAIKSRQAVIHEIESQLDVVLWTLDTRSGRVIYASSSYETIWNRSRDALMQDANGWTRSILAEDRPRVLAAMDHMLRTGEPFEEEYRIALPDGAERWIRDRGIRVGDPNTAPTHAVGIARDITEERRIRFQLQAAVLAAEQAEHAERKLLAGALHDSVGQLLPLTRMKLDALLDEEAARDLREPLHELRTLLKRAEEEIRALTFRMSPLPVEELGLVVALEHLAEIMAEQYGLSVSVRSDGRDVPLDEDRAAVLFRGVRELLINVSKHAGTGDAEVWIEREEDTVVVTVQDGGTGFDPVVNRPTGFGLLSLRDQVEGMGGRMRLDSGLERGTRVRLVMPVPGGASD